MQIAAGMLRSRPVLTILRDPAFDSAPFTFKHAIAAHKVSERAKPLFVVEGQSAEPEKAKRGF